MYFRLTLFFFSVNWDGIIDRETGIMGYTVYVGQKECEDLVHPHHDPQKHLFDKSQWTHSAMISPIPDPYTILPGNLLYYKYFACKKHTC